MEKEGRVSSQLHHGNDHKGDETKPLHSWLECSPNVDKTELTLPTTNRGAPPPLMAKLLRLFIHQRYLHTCL